MRSSTVLSAYSIACYESGTAAAFCYVEKWRRVLQIRQRQATKFRDYLLRRLELADAAEGER